MGFEVVISCLFGDVTSFYCDTQAEAVELLELLKSKMSVSSGTTMYIRNNDGDNHYPDRDDYFDI